MIDWTQVLVAFLAVGIPATLTSLGAIMLGWKKLSLQISDNTRLTRAGNMVGAHNARVALSAESKVDDLKLQMNGAMDERMRSIVKEELRPILEALAAMKGN